MDNESRRLASLSPEGRYRLLVEAITDYAIYMLDSDGHVSSWNPGAERFKGYTSDEVMGQHFSRFYTPEDRASGLPGRALETARTSGRFEAEGWRIRKDGSRFWAYVVIDPIVADGEVVGFAKVTRDLTERRKAEEDLRRKEEQFRLLVQGVTDYAICMLTPEGVVSNWNSGAERIKGYRAEEIVGKHISEFYSEEDRSACEPQRALAAARKEGRIEREGWRIRKDRSRFFAHVVIDAIRDDDGDLIGFAKITRDITERMEAQKQLDKTRDALFHSQKMEAIGRLTGGIAHDFNNLLMAIQSSLELMRKRLPDDQRLHDLLKNAVAGAQRGSSLTKRMLAFARRQQLTPESVDIPRLVRGMTDLLERAVGADIAIETRFPLACRPVVIDANQLEMALLNLAVNARDAMPEGGQLTITAKEHRIGSDNNLKPGDYICLSVADTGVGMDDETLDQALEPFFTTKGPGKGTGLGLPMVLGLAEQSGGELRLRSKQGQGTTAELWIPAASAAMRPQVSIASETLAPPAVTALTVLAVDDDALILMNTQAMLEDLGHCVMTASSAMHALAILRSGQRIDLVVTDQAMPQMTGVQLAAVAMKERPGLPVLIATGYAELDSSLARELPRLAKPFTEKELATAISKLFGPDKLVNSERTC